MRPAADLVSRTLGEVARWIQPGVTTHRLDTIAREFIRDNGGKLGLSWLWRLSGDALY